MRQDYTVEVGVEITEPWRAKARRVVRVVAIVGLITLGDILAFNDWTPRKYAGVALMLAVLMYVADELACRSFVSRAGREP